MKMRNTSLVLFIFFISCGAIMAQGQIIDATVHVDMERLTPEHRIDVSTMANDVEKYLNSQDFMEEWEGPPIPVDVQIYLSGGVNNMYSARLFVASKRYIDGTEDGMSVELKLIDNEWQFEYSRGAMFSFNPYRFNSFISMLDFYMLVVIGYDLDTYGELAGTPAYNKAKQIVNMGSGKGAPGYDTYVQPGEYNKYNLVRELTSLKYEDFRKLTFEYYVDGLDRIAYDKEEALLTIDYILTDMVEFKKSLTSASVVLQVFFDAKSRELAELFKDYEDKSVYDKLMYLDPSSSTIYREALEE